jgi:hypothetical protein
MQRAVVFAFLLLAGTAQAATYRQELDALTWGMPHAVRAFIDRRANCHHWMGEEPYDAARRQQITLAYTTLRCAALEQDERTLKHLYRANSRIPRALDRSRDWLAG